MSLQDIALFRAVSAKMDFINQRQSVISQNIANADTPGYRPQDMAKVDFEGMVKDITQDKTVRVETTNPMHMPNPEEQLNARAQKQRETYEVAPAGNAVIMEEQLLNSNKNMMDYSLMLNIYQKQVGMIRTALGQR